MAQLLDLKTNTKATLSLPQRENRCTILTGKVPVGVARLAQNNTCIGLMGAIEGSTTPLYHEGFSDFYH